MSAPTRIPPDVRARLRDLRLSSRRGIASGGIGQHLSRHRGAGLEFAQYRSYEQGDEPRRIDWKLYARSDRYFVRESERDAALTVWVLIDATASMAQASREAPLFSKLDAARLIAACTFEVAMRQGDRFGLVIASGNGLNLVSADVGTRQRDRCVVAMDAVSATGGWPADVVVKPVWDRMAPGALVLLLSDDFDDAVVALAERLSSARRDVCSIQLLTRDELDFDFRGGHRFVEPETGDELRIDGGAARADYLQRFSAARTALRQRFAAAQVLHAEHPIDRAPDAALARFFGTRTAEARNA